MSKESQSYLAIVVPLFVLYVTGLAYTAAYLYWVAYFGYFQVPEIYIKIDARSMMAAWFSIWGGIVTATIVFLYFFEKIRKSKGAVTTGQYWIALLLVMLPFEIGAMISGNFAIHVLLVWMEILVVVPAVILPLCRYKGSISNRYAGAVNGMRGRISNLTPLERKVWLTAALLIYMSLSCCMLGYVTGDQRARTQIEFGVIDEGGVSHVILTTHEENIVTAPFNIDNHYVHGGIRLFSEPDLSRDGTLLREKRVGPIKTFFWMEGRLEGLKKELIQKGLLHKK